MQQNNGNMFAAIALSVIVLVGYHYFFERPRLEAVRAEQARSLAAVEPTVATAAAETDGTSERIRADIIADGLKTSERIKITTPRLHGSLNLRGGRIDDLTLADYHTATDPQSPEVVLLSPSGAAKPDHGYFAEFGWLKGDAGENVKLPGATTLWRTSSTTLTPETPLTMTWDNGAGLTFTRTVSIDDNYMFTVTDSVKNSAGAVTLYPYASIARQAHPDVEDLFILHEGAVGVFDGRLHEAGYKAMNEDRDDGHTVEKASPQGGWLGITDKYWLTALVPGGDFTGRMQAVSVGSRYQTDARGTAVTVAANGSATVTQQFFAGAKEIRLLDEYADKGINHFDKAVDFGWFYFLTKPFFYALDGIARTFARTGYGFAIAILIFTVIVRGAFFPLQNKSYIAMNKMRALQPKLIELRERHKDDKQQLNVQMFELYKREKVNPMAGCWPMLVQIPVFFALYKVLYVAIEMRHAPFWGWITDLSAPDTTSVFNLFGLLPYDVPSMLQIGAWPLLMGLTMFLQQKLSPTSPDPVQAAMFKWLPVIFTIMLAHFPAGLVIYWSWSNLLAVTQQYVLLKRHR